MWERAHRPDDFERIHKALTIDGFITLKLTGRPVCHYSGAAFYGVAYNLLERRFEREARAMSRLQHHNVVPIYDVGSADGLHYAVTELLEGDTLRERITPTGLPWQKVTQIGAAVADGLAAAHALGIEGEAEP